MARSWVLGGEPASPSQRAALGCRNVYALLTTAEAYAGDQRLPCPARSAVIGRIGATRRGSQLPEPAATLGLLSAKIAAHEVPKVPQLAIPGRGFSVVRL